MIRVILPSHLRTLAHTEAEVTLAVAGPVTQRSVLDALEARYPMLKPASRKTGEIRGTGAGHPRTTSDHDIQQRFRICLRLCIDIQYICISKRWEAAMQVSKWGNSLAIRIPSEVVDALELKEGDQIEIRIANTREFEVRRDPARRRALERLRKLRRPLPAGFAFDRADANAR